MNIRYIRLIILCAVGLILFTGCKGESIKEKVLNVFEENKDIIIERLENDSLEENIDWYDLEGVIRTGKYKDGVIEFACVSEGILTSSVVAGFYYSPSDEAYIVEWFSGEELKEDGNGFSYTDGFDNIYYTERIEDNFYYFKTSN